jgi:hypothetical protein
VKTSKNKLWICPFFFLLYWNKYLRFANNIIESWNIPIERERVQKVSSKKEWKSLLLLFYEPYDENNMDLLCCIFSNSFSNFFTSKPLKDESEMKSRNKDEKSKVFSFTLNVYFIEGLQLVTIFTKDSTLPCQSCYPLRLIVYPWDIFMSFKFKGKCLREEFGWRAKKINMKFYLRCEGNVRKINIVCWVEKFSASSTRNSVKRRKVSSRRQI